METGVGGLDISCEIISSSGGGCVSFSSLELPLSSF